MGVLTHEADFSSRVAPARLFKALALDNVNLVPKVSTDVKSIEILEGDGGVGTIKKLNFKQGEGLTDKLEKINYAIVKIEAIDIDNLEYSYSLIEGEGLTDKLEKITYVTKFVEAPGGGSVIKTISKYHTKGEHHGITHEDNIKERKDKSIKIFNILDKYLLENPHAYI